MVEGGRRREKEGMQGKEKKRSKHIERRKEGGKGGIRKT